MGDCSNSPDGFHQVDTSMEEGPNNCFYCGQSMVGYVRPATRPQPSAEPVAYLKEWDDVGARRLRVDLRPDHDPWLDHYEPTVTPLYPASALEAARREALEEAAKRVEQFERPRMDHDEYTFIREAANAVRALKENTNG